MKTYNVNNRTTITVNQLAFDEYDVIVRNNGRLGKPFYCDFDYLKNRYPTLANKFDNDFINTLNTVK